jgi:DNA invertase Pin-like site-specific DNA recombinase
MELPIARLANAYIEPNEGENPMATAKFVSYLRVSTARQGRSGLGLEAQRDAVKNYLDGGKWKLLAEIVEVESGKKNDRPKLKEALHRARVTGATLVVAKLDRLSRNATFLGNLKEANVKFVCCDMPDANELTIGIMAQIAEHERKMISVRTKAALAVAKKRGVKLGNPNGADAFGDIANDAAVAMIKAKANAFAADIMPIIEHIQGEGFNTYGDIAVKLNEREIKTARGGQWHAGTVRDIMLRMEAIC